MLNKNHVAEIRTCQRIKFDQALYILTMYQKKIRNQIKFDGERPIDVEKQYDQKIIHSWNGKWKIDLTKPLLNCVTSVSPRVILSIDQQENDMKEEKENDEYNRIMLQFIRRMRAEHEDQSNFKLTEIDINEKDQNFQKYKKNGLKAWQNYLSTIQTIGDGMKQSINQYGEDYELQENEGSNYLLEIGSRIEQILEVCKQIDQKIDQQDLLKFICSTMTVFDRIKQSQHGSTLLTVQPDLKQFTYLLHPLFIPIYGYLLQQKDQIKSKMENRQNKEPEEAKLPFKNFFCSNTTSLCKIAFINLDGYESQFNLQFARCFKKNMLYVSFPKEDIHSANDMNSIYEQRLYKKIMYNWEKNKMKFDKKSMDNKANIADKLYFLTHNIQNYFQNVQNTLYRSEGPSEDLNRNMFVFPLRLNTLNQNFNNLIPEDEDDTIQVYESYAILQIFKYFLINQIKQFGPTFIIVSHSGRLNIEQAHFIQIMQELTKLSNYKLVFFPNLTARFCPSQKAGIDHQINISNIDYLQRKYKQNGQQLQNDEDVNISFDFFNKIAKFLKISSGTHNLTKNFEEEDLLSKHRNLNVLRRINRLMQVLGNQYENIEKIRFKSSQIDLIPKLYQKDAQKIMKTFEKLVPTFYIQLYQLIQSIISVCQMPSQKRAYIDLAKYNMDPLTIRNNPIIRDLISFINSKVVVRNVGNQSDRQQVIFEKMKKYLNCQKDKHFLEISQEKYEDSVLLHFKVQKNCQIFDQIQDGKLNISGLIDISFSSPSKDIKQCMHIYDSTQIIYKLDQSNASGNIPILIMNHLPLQKKAISKFDNYCAFLKKDVLSKLVNVKHNQQGIEKIYEEKKIKPYLIKFFDEENREIIQNKFQFRTQWNYCQTQNYMILFWPQLFNFVEAVSYKLQGRCYQPGILNEFFIGKKQVVNDVVCFYKANVPQDIAPRTGCSAYEYKDFIYIFGGFYQRTKNYLSLQRDITMLNLGLYTHDGHRKLQVTNLKDDLYEMIPIDNKRQKKPQTYVRPRRQFQFFEMDDLSVDHESEDGIHQVVMVGGVGQNFIHPFSLLTYYYYVLRIDQQTGRLLSIKKQIVYNRSIPVNVRRASKNMGIIKTPIRNKNEGNGKTINSKPQLSEPYSYARFRIVYKIEKGQFKYKFQYVFSERDCKMLKQQLRKYEDEKYEVGELSNIRMEKIEGMNHMFMIQKYGSKQIVHLRLQIDGVTDQKQQQFKLSHDSIYYLNIINGNYVCAIVKHPIFTNDRSLLVECKVKTIENQNLSEDQAPYVSLKPIHTQLKGDLTLHIIQASNINLIYVLHGYRLYNSNNIYQYQITHNRKSGTKSVSQIKPKKDNEYLRSKSVPKCCYSTFLYKKVDIKNQIVCQSYLCFEEDQNVITRVDQYFDPSDSNNMCWILRQPILRYIFYLNSPANPINLERMVFLDFYRQESSRTIVVQYNKKKYIIKITGSEPVLETGEIAVMLEPANEVSIRILDEQEFERGTILTKKPIHYIDKGYEKSD